MEERTTVKDLIDTIKKEGIQEADKKKEQIIQDASKKAEEIVAGAKKESERIIEHANEEAERVKVTAEKALSQAGRNLLISLRQEIMNLFNRITEREVASVMTSDIMKDIILKIVEKWELKENFPGLEVLVRKEDLKKLQEALSRSLHEEWKSGVILKPVEGIKAGFQIGERDSNIHYNFTEKGITEILSEYLNPQIARFLEGREQEDVKENQ